MIIESILFVFIFCLSKKYNFSNIEYFPKKYISFSLAFIVINFVLILWAKTATNWDNIRILHLLSFVFLYPYMIKNYKYKGMIILITGVSLNFIVMYLNGLKMPIDGYFYKQIVSDANFMATKMGRNLYHSLIDDNTLYYQLADIIPLLKPYPFPKIISIGDIFIAIGFSTVAITTIRGDYTEK
ncbi:MAG: DUF5317 domain-containing protein [Ezakiella sp.]|nr:DUF5317 domain-containing protein [Ezakiella sp.]MDY3923363.1 DUF5317 domain-containing protein [Ezakiella sp.]